MLCVSMDPSLIIGPTFPHIHINTTTRYSPNGLQYYSFQESTTLLDTQTLSHPIIWANYHQGRPQGPITAAWGHSPEKILKKKK